MLVRFQTFRETRRAYLKRENVTRFNEQTLRRLKRFVTFQKRIDRINEQKRKTKINAKKKRAKKQKIKFNKKFEDSITNNFDFNQIRLNVFLIIKSKSISKKTKIFIISSFAQKQYIDNIEKQINFVVNNI